ncbi:MAG: hypothetical protein MK009_09890 [Gammaproteobacteria bacterium]|nr:hypothetical protein [Gammaproteobacteria bacterium]
MPRRTATISPSDVELEKEEVTSEHEAEDKANDVLALSDLKSLIYLGRLEKTVDVGGFSFKIATLTTSQQRDVMSSIMTDGNATERMLDIKPLTMSYAVLTVNGVDLETLCTDESITSVEKRRLNVIMNLQSVLLEKLYREYDELVTRSGKDIGIEDLKE